MLSCLGAAEQSTIATMSFDPHLNGGAMMKD